MIRWPLPSARVFRARQAIGRWAAGAADALVVARDEKPPEAVAPPLAGPAATSADLHRRVLASLARLDQDGVADLALSLIPPAPEIQPQVISLLTSRPAWGSKLLSAIAAGQVDRGAEHESVRKLLDPATRARER